MSAAQRGKSGEARSRRVRLFPNINRGFGKPIQPHLFPSAGLAPSLSSGIIHRHARSHGNSSPFLSHHPNSRSLSVGLIAGEDCGARKNNNKKKQQHTDIEIAVPASVGFNGGAKIDHAHVHAGTHARTCSYNRIGVPPQQ